MLGRTLRDVAGRAHVAWKGAAGREPLPGQRLLRPRGDALPGDRSATRRDPAGWRSAYAGHTRSDHPVSQKTNQTSHRGFYEIHYVEPKTLVEKVWERHVEQRAEGERPTFAAPVAAT